MVVSFYTSINNNWEFQLFHILTNVWYCLFILDSLVCFSAYIYDFWAVHTVHMISEHCWLRCRGQHTTILKGFNLNLDYIGDTKIYRLGELTFIKCSRHFWHLLLHEKVHMFKGIYISSYCSLFVTEFMLVKYIWN